MRASTIFLTLAILISGLMAAACGAANPDNRVIKSAKTDNLIITLSSATGELKSGENVLVISFADASGNPVDVGAASLKFHMPAMGAMAEMNDVATLTTTDTAGRYRAEINIEMKGTWEAIIQYQGAHGTGQTSMSVMTQ